MKKKIAFLLCILLILGTPVSALAAVPLEYYKTALSFEKTGKTAIKSIKNKDAFNSKIAELINDYDSDYFSEIVIDVENNTIQKDDGEVIALEKYGIDYGNVESEEPLVAAVPVLDALGARASLDEENGEVVVPGENGYERYEFADKSEFSDSEIVASSTEGGVETNLTKDSYEKRPIGYFTADQGEENFALKSEYSNGEIVVTSPYQTKRLIVTMKPGKKLRNTNGAVECITDANGCYILQYDSELSAKKAHEKFGQNADVSSAESDTVVKAYGLSDRSGAEVIQSDRYKQYLTENNKQTQIVVAVIDTGADVTHEFLSDRMLEGYNVYDESADVTDVHGHGTHVSGIVADNTNKNVKILPVKALNDEGKGSSIAIKIGIEYAIAHGADVINMSFGGICNSTGMCAIEQGVREAIDENVTCVVSSGNESTDCTKCCPAKISECITVASCNTDGKSISSFSNYGDTVDIAAPGDGILSCKNGGGYVRMSGTSMSTPFIAAASAMLLTDAPELAPNEVESKLKSYTSDILIRGQDKYSGAGVLNFGLFFGENIVANSISLNSYSASLIYFSKTAPYSIKVSVKNKESGKIATDRSFTVSTSNEKVAYCDGMYIIPTGEGKATLLFKVGKYNQKFVVTVKRAESWVDYAADEFSSGDGSAENPFVIETPEQLAKMVVESSEENHFKNQYLKLANDIDLGGKYWHSIRTFEGFFDGDNHKIKNMKIFNEPYKNSWGSNSTINSNWYYNYGLFHTVECATIKNLGLENVYCDNSYGAPLAYSVLQNTTIENCYSSGFSGGSGLFGSVTNYNIRIRNCYSSATVLNAGIARQLYSSKSYGGCIVSNTFFCGKLLSSDDNNSSAPFASTIESQEGYQYTELYNCFAGSAGANGIGFANTQMHSQLFNCYFDKGSTYGIKSNETTEKIDLRSIGNERFKQKETYLDSELWNTSYQWDFENIWAVDPEINNGYPYLKNMIPEKSAADHNGTWMDFAADSYAGGMGTKNNPYLIETAEQLARISCLFRFGGGSDLYFKLTSDIDLSGHNWNPIGAGDDINSLKNASYADGKRFFFGNIDGNGHKISNMTIKSTGDYIGFISKCEDSVIKNLNFENANVSGNLYVGVIAGIGRYYCDFAYCNVSGSVKSNAYSRGAITAMLDANSRVIGCDFAPNMSAGIVCTNYGIIEKCALSGKSFYPFENYGVLQNNFCLGMSYDAISYTSTYGRRVNNYIYNPEGSIKIFTENGEFIIDKDTDITKEDFVGFDFENVWKEVEPVIDDETGRQVFLPVLRDGYEEPAALPEEEWKDVAKNDLTGNGTEEDPYLIATAEQLAWFTLNTGKYKDRHIRLVNDIDLGGKLWCTQVSGAISLCSFYFDGNNKTIYNLTAKNGGGLFCYDSSGEIKNLHIKNIIGRTSTAIVYMNRGTIKDCTVDGNINVALYMSPTYGNNESQVGAITASNYGVIENCAVNSVVRSGARNCGSITGFNAGTVRNCYVGGMVSGSSTGLGVFAGNNNGGLVEKCYSTATLIKTNLSGTGTKLGIIDSYYRDADLKNKDTFVGWDFDTVWDINENINDGYPFLRHPVSKSITYVLNGGSNPIYAQHDYIPGNTVTLHSAEKYGYAFEGWYSEPELINQISVIDSSRNSDITLYAKWSQNTYELTFDTGEGCESINSVFIKPDQSYKLPGSNLTRDNYTFIGWAKTKKGNAIYKPGDTVIGLGKKGDKVTLYAKWLKDSYQICFDSNGGSGYIDSLKVDIDEYITLPSCTFAYPGHIFKGWALSKDGEVKFDDKETVKNLGYKNAAIYLYAIWEQHYVIKFDACGGSGNMKPFTVDASKSTLPKNLFTKKGYTFAGWSPEKGGTALYQDEDLLDRISCNKSELILYAVWNKNLYPATFNANGGKFSDGSQQRTVQTPYGSYPDISDVPVLEGMRFIGWSPELSRMTESGASYTALWVKSVMCTYTIQYFVMGNDGKYRLKNTYQKTAMNYDKVDFRPVVEKCYALDTKKSVLSGIVKENEPLVISVYTYPVNHKLKHIAATTACTKDGKEEYYHCDSCGKNFEDPKAEKEILDLTQWGIIPKRGHKSKSTVLKATTSTDGKIMKTCTVCKKKLSTTVIPKVSTVKLSAKSFAFDGKTKTPAVVVKNSAGKALVKNTDYTVSYSGGRKSAGEYKVKIAFKGKYSGSKTLSFKVLPALTKKISASPAASKVKLTWKAVPGATGYKVYIYNTSTKKYAALKKLTNTSYTVSNLKSGTTYRFAVKAYINESGTNYWSEDYKTVTVVTKPGTPTLKVKSSSKKATLSWNKQTGATGYVVYMATSRNGKYKKIATLKSNKKLSYTKADLKTGKTYYFKVAAYSTVTGKNVYGSFSSVKNVKIK